MTTTPNSSTPLAADRATAEVIARAVSAYRVKFGEEPAVVAFAPGRANLIGDHTDYCDGFVMPVALEIGCACAMGPADTIDAIAADFDSDGVSLPADRPATVSDLDDDRSWQRYVVGSFEVTRRHADIGHTGARMALASSVPTGSGLSSSAAVEVSIITATNALFGLGLDTLQIAKLGQQAEHEFAGVPCGIMDQLASAAGQPDRAIMIDCRSLDLTLTSLPEADDAVFVLVDSAVKHSNASGAYAARRSACESASAKLGVPALRDANADMIAGVGEALTDDERRAAEHVVSENARVLAFSSALAEGDIEAAGELLDQSHASLSDVYRVSCDELDTLAKICRETPGILGARMTGGGFGGWVVALVESHAIDAIDNHVIPAFQAATGNVSSSRIIRPSQGARVIDTNG
ncbi:MAG: galactokinase [Planctomycetota bacterium]